MKSIYQFDDYREYLSHHYLERKKQNPSYSHAHFTHAAGIHSRNYLRLVISGKRRLTSSTIHQFAQALQLSPEEVEYFEALVHYNQSKFPRETRFYRERVRKLRKQRPTDLARVKPDSLISRWYIPAILVLVHGRTESDFPKLAKKIGISLHEWNAAIQLLTKLNYLEHHVTHFKMNHRQIISHDNNAGNQAQHAYLGSQIERSLIAYRTQYGPRAKFHSHTFTIAPDRFSGLSGELQSVIEKFVDRQCDDSGDEVVQFNVQLFSAT